MYYDVSLVYRDNRKVETIVVYSSDIDNVMNYLDAGSVKYSIRTFYMKNLDGDSTFEKIKMKVEKGERLKNSEMLGLTLVPLMNSKKSKADRAVESIKLAGKIKNSENKLQCLSMLYALLDKFGDANIKENIWEVFNMTEIGKMIMEQGLKKGLKEGKSETLIKQLVKKFGKVPDEYKENIKKLPVEIIDIISLEIFDMKKLREIEKYF